MNKEELVDFLKSNLKLEIETINDSDGDTKVSIFIKLENETIMDDYFYIF